MLRYANFLYPTVLTSFYQKSLLAPSYLTIYTYLNFHAKRAHSNRALIYSIVCNIAALWNSKKLILVQIALEDKRYKNNSHTHVFYVLWKSRPFLPCCVPSSIMNLKYFITLEKTDLKLKAPWMPIILIKKLFWMS